MRGASENKYCLVGKSLPHTLSPRIHALFGGEGYGVREIADEAALEKFVKSGEYAGYNVTIPYKRSIIPLLDRLSEEAEKIGAVNTVVRVGDKLAGYNTDIGGMEYAMRKAGIELRGRNILILGSGGTCQTAKYLCATSGAASVNVVSRSGECNYESCYDLQDTQVIINTTPVGMSPNAYAKPLNIKKYSKLESVFDCIYNPLETLLVRDAREMGLKAANGLNMLVEQARLARNLFQAAVGGQSTGESETERAARTLIYERKNIILIGMAGCGKSSIGRRVAEKLGREFIDTDVEIERAEGRTIPEIFATSGEAYFREVERREVEKACLKLGAVVATGGGAVLDERNRFFFRANGFCAAISRDADKLARAGRPLSKSLDEVKRLASARYPLYMQACDFEIENNDKIESAVESVIAAFEGSIGREI